MSPRPVVAFVMVFALLLSAGCGDGIGSFKFTEESEEVVVEGRGLGVPVQLPTFPIDINLEQELEKRDAKGAKAIFLEETKLEITGTEMPDGDTDNFDFLESIEIYVEPENSNSDLEKKLVAERTDVPDGQQSVTLNTKSDVDLKPYVEAGLKMTTEATIDSTKPEDDTSLKAIVTLRVEVL